MNLHKHLQSNNIVSVILSQNCIHDRATTPNFLTVTFFFFNEIRFCNIPDYSWIFRFTLVPVPSLVFCDNISFN